MLARDASKVEKMAMPKVGGSTCVKMSVTGYGQGQGK